MKKNISVIIPIYNNEKYLEKCLESVCSQTYKNLQIILVNDGSNDDSLIICKNFKESDIRVELYSQENLGVSSARNLGLRRAVGDYVTFVDSDDYLEIDAYEKAMGVISDFDALFFSYQEEYPECHHSRIYNQQKKGVVISDEAIYECMKPLGYEAVVWNKIYKRSLLSNLFFNEKYGIAEDWLWTIQAIKKMNSIYLLNLPLYHYVQTEQSAWRSGLAIDKKWDQVFELSDDLSTVIKDNKKNITMSQARMYNDYYQLVWRSYLTDEKDKIPVFREHLRKFRRSFYLCKEYSIKKKIRYYLIDYLIRIKVPKRFIYWISQSTSYKFKTLICEGKRL